MSRHDRSAIRNAKHLTNHPEQSTTTHGSFLYNGATFRQSHAFADRGDIVGSNVLSIKCEYAILRSERGSSYGTAESESNALFSTKRNPVGVTKSISLAATKFFAIDVAFKLNEHGAVRLSIRDAE